MLPEWFLVLSGWLVLAVGLIGTAILGIALFWYLLDRIIEVLELKDVFIEFAFRRHRCTCGAVGPNRKRAKRPAEPLPTIPRSTDPRRSLD